MPKLLDVTLVFGPEKGGVLNALSASLRNCTLTCSMTWKLLKRTGGTRIGAGSSECGSAQISANQRNIPPQSLQRSTMTMFIAG